MAVLSSIRSKGKLIAVCVGGALLAFVLGDFISSGQAIFGASQTKMGDINGTTIDYRQFENQVKAREQFTQLIYGRSDGNAADEIRENVWQQAVRENTILKNANDQGIIVTDAEIANLIQTGYVTSTIRQLFADQQTGLYDPSKVTRFMQEGTDAQSRFIWQNLEDELRESRQLSKYLEMVNAGLYVTTAEVEREFAQRTQLSDIKYVAIPYSDIKDEEVSVSEDKLKTFYNENIKRYESTTETRDLSYVVFDVIPTQKDSAAALEIANSIKDGLASATPAEVESYINSKSDVPYSPFHYNKGELNNPIVDEMMFANEPGFVYGPYVDGEYYSLARLISKDMLSDSVEVSHILLVVSNPADSLKVKAKADSLLDVHKSGINFGALAAQFSDDQGSSADSGKLGWVTERTNFIPEFKNACFATDKGKTTIVKSMYGYHIIKVTNKTAPKLKVAVGIASVDIRPSSQTRQAAYALASEFAGRNRTRKQFDEAVTAQKLVARVAPRLTANTRQIPGIENSREIIRDAFNDEKAKEVSGVYEMGDRFIVAVLTGIHPKGTQTLASVKTEVTRLATNDAKGDAILAKLGTVSSVEDAAGKMGKEVKDANSIHLDMMQIPGIGFEPKVIAAAAALQQGQVSKPIKGENGVYVLQNTSYTPAQAIQPLNITTDKKMMQSDLTNRASYQIYNAVMDQANITDQRVKFF
ncbi:MAG: SurA N-terminal domain-containing protein [Bacteroidales bacterium]|nr:SurA N-terminal domain-containing protein [Bacteroidales bacterium]